MATLRTTVISFGLAWLISNQALGQAPPATEDNGSGVVAPKLLEAASKAGSADAAFRLAELYRTGQSGLRQDTRLAFRYYREAVRLGNHAEAMNTLGILYEQGAGVQASQATAIDWFEKAAQAGSARARANLGKIHARGENGVQDFRLATTELKKAAGDWLSIRVPMKQVNVTRGIKFSYSAASISQGADEEEPEYDWIVSRRVKWDSHELRRPIFDPNYDSAKDADITVVDLRSVGDELLIDIGIFDGRRPNQKPVHLMVLFDVDGRAGAVQAFQLKGAPAQAPTKLPNADSGVQVVLGADRSKPVPVFLLSDTAPKPLPNGHYFRGNNAGAQHDLGIIYTYGKENAPEVGGEVNQNYQTAADWFFRAAEQGHAGAQNNLGVLYFKGTQTRRDQRRMSQRQPEPKPIEQAAYWYRLAAAQDYADAQANLGFLYETGLVTTDIVGKKIPSLLKASRDLYLQAADPDDLLTARGESTFAASGESLLGLAVAQHHLGSLFDPGEPLAKDLPPVAEQELKQAKNAAKSEFWYRQAALKDHAASQLRLAKRILGRENVSADDRLEALKWLYLVADKSDEEADHELRDREAKQAGVLAESARLEADLFLPSAEKTDDEQVGDRAEVERLAKQVRFGDLKSIYELGRNYQLGTLSMKQDLTRSFRLYLRAAKKGHAGAQFHLASLYSSASGVPYSFRRGFGGARAMQLRDNVEAAKWYEKAAEQEHPEAAYYLGNLYAQGSVELRRDFGKAAEWFAEAAKVGHTGAMNNLGYLYDEGLGVKKDHAKALGHYRNAAEAGHAGAQLNLSAFYSAGIGGVTKDLTKALGWAEKAAAQGEPGAAEKVAAIRHLLRK